MANLTSLRPAVNLLAGCSSGKQVQDQLISVRVCPVAQFGFLSTACDPRGQWLYSGRMIRDASPNLLHLRTREEMRPALHHRQNSPFLKILMFFFVQGLVDPLTNLVDLILILQIRQITLDFHQDCLQLLHLLVEKEQEPWINRVIASAITITRASTFSHSSD